MDEIRSDHYDECPHPAEPCVCAAVNAEAEAYYADLDDTFAQELSWRYGAET